MYTARESWLSRKMLAMAAHTVTAARVLWLHDDVEQLRRNGEM
jgi:hypothetical protein